MFGHSGKIPITTKPHAILLTSNDPIIRERAELLAKLEPIQRRLGELSALEKERNIKENNSLSRRFHGLCEEGSKPPETFSKIMAMASEGD